MKTDIDLSKNVQLGDYLHGCGIDGKGMDGKGMVALKYLHVKVSNLCRQSIK